MANQSMTEKERARLTAGRENIYRKPLCSGNPLWKACQRLLWYSAVLPMFHLIFRPFFGLKVENKEIIRRLRGKGFVIVCNHIHVVDSVMVAIAASPRHPFFTSQEETFYIAGFRTLLRVLNCVPILKEDLQTFLDSMVAQLKKGRPVLVYPEGEIRVLCDHLRKFSNGAFTLAQRADVPVVPMVITPRERRGIWKLLRRRFCLTVTVGEPLYPLREDKPERLSVIALRDKTFAQMERMLENGGHAYPPEDLHNPDAFWQVKKSKQI